MISGPTYLIEQREKSFELLAEVEKGRENHNKIQQI